MKRVLHLNLKAEYFNEIKRGDKEYEYRLQTPYWKRRLVGREYDEVHIKLGYPKGGDRKRILRFPWRGFDYKVIKPPHFGERFVGVYAIRVLK